MKTSIFCFHVFFKFDVKKFFMFCYFFSAIEYGGCKSNLRAFGCNLRDAKEKENFLKSI